MRALKLYLNPEIGAPVYKLVPAPTVRSYCSLLWAEGADGDDRGRNGLSRSRLRYAFFHRCSQLIRIPVDRPDSSLRGGRDSAQSQIHPPLLCQLH